MATFAQEWVMVPFCHQWDAIHPTHSPWITAGTARRNLCGKYSSSNRTLRNECVGEDETGSRGSLNLLRSGRHPHPKAKRWPDGEIAATVQQAMSTANSRSSAIERGTQQPTKKALHAKAMKCHGEPQKQDRHPAVSRPDIEVERGRTITERITAGSSLQRDEPPLSEQAPLR